MVKSCGVNWFSPLAFLLLIGWTLAGNAPARSSATGFVNIKFQGGMYWKGHRSMILQGDYAYTRAYHGLVSFDISDPTQPFPVGHLFLNEVNQLGAPFAAANDRVYVASFPWWFIIDVGDPHHPVEISRTEVAYNIRGIGVAGNHVYIGTQANGVMVFDISIPEAPLLVQSVPVAAGTAEIVVSGDRLYTTGSELNILDISTPSAPVFLGATSGLSLPIQLSVQGTYAYVANHPLDGNLYTIDVANPATPQIVNTLYVATGITDLAVEGAHGVAMLDATYSVDLDLINPAAPVASGSIQMTVPKAVRIRDTLALICNRLSIQVYNLKTAHSPVLVGGYQNDVSLQTVAAGRGYVYAVEGDDSIMVIDATDPVNPSLVLTVPGYYTNISLHDSTLLVQHPITVGTIPPRTHVFDVSNPGAPQLLSEFDASSRPYRYRWQDSLVFVETGSGTDIWNLADPAHPQILSALNDEPLAWPTPYDTVLYLYVNYSQRIVAYDISDPANPLEIGALDSTGFTVTLDRIDSVLLQIRHADPYELVTYDVSDPLAMTPLGVLPLDSISSPPIVAAGYLVVATSRMGVIAIDIGDPTDPQIVSSFPANRIGAVASMGDQLVMIGSNGLIITEVATSPSIARGDVNADLVITASDIVYLVNYTFKGGPAPLPDPSNGDVTCDGAVGAADIIYLVIFVFKSGPAPGCP